MDVLCWFDFMLVIAICGLFSYVVTNMDNFECNMCCELFPSSCQTWDDCQTSNKVSMIIRLLILG